MNIQWNIQCKIWFLFATTAIAFMVSFGSTITVEAIPGESLAEKPSQVALQEKAATPKEDTHYFHIPRLGIHIKRDDKKGDFTVTSVDADGPSAKQLKLGDTLRVKESNPKNGWRTANPFGVLDVGEITELGLALDEAAKKGELQLVARSDKGEPWRDVKYEVEKKKLSKKLFVQDDERRHAMIDTLLKFLLAKQSRGSFAPEESTSCECVITGLVGMALLAHDSKKYEEEIKTATEYMLRNLSRDRMYSSRYPSRSYEPWGMSFGGLFLCEYYFATGDKEVLPKIAELVKELCTYQTKDGVWMHSFQRVETDSYRELNAVSNYVMLFLAAAKAAGAEVPEESTNRAVERLEKCCNGGFIAYNYDKRDYTPAPGGISRCALTGLALEKYDGSKMMIKQIKNFVKSNERGWMHGHPAPSIHFYAMAVYYRNNCSKKMKSIGKKEPLARYYEFLKYLYTLSMTKEGTICAQPNNDTREDFQDTGDENSDVQIGETYRTALAAITLTAVDQKLWHFGGKPKHLPKKGKK